MKRKSKKGGDFGQIANDAYDGAAAFGLFMAVLELWAGCIIGLILIGFGIYFLVKKPSPSTPPSSGSKQSPSTPPSTPATTQSTTTLGLILIGVGLVIAIIAIVHWYIVKTYKFAAAASGVGDAVGIVDQTFDNIV